MKQKIGTQIEEEIMKLAKRKAAEEGRSISDLIQDALVQYLSTGAASPKEREMAYQSFCERPLKLKPEQFRQVLEEDVWDR
jgi:plasmid stability protein